MNKVSRSQITRVNDQASIPAESRRLLLPQSDQSRSKSTHNEHGLTIEISSSGKPNIWSLDPIEIQAAFPMSKSSMALVAQLFRENCIEKIRVMYLAIDRDDFETVAQQAHGLRGSLAMFASSLTIELLSRVELAVKLRTREQAKQALQLFEQALEKLRPTLDQLINA